MRIQTIQGVAVFPGRQAGFSMVELLVTISIAAILLAIAIPSMTAMLATQRAKSLASALLNSLVFARNEAIKRNARVVVCKSASGSDCLTSGGWDQGWVVFHDANNNAAMDTGEAVMLIQSAASPDLHLTGNTQVASYVSYSASGSAKLISGAFQVGTLTLCQEPVSVADIRKIILSATGRARLFTGSAADC